MENSKLHILVVDDDDRIRNLLKDYLSENQYIVSTAENADQAKFKIEQIRFDILILDVMMPGQNGYELTKEIKRKLKTPIILLTAKGEVENRIEGLKIGADDYVAKPFEPEELFLRIKKLLDLFKTNKNINKSIIFGEFSFNITTLQLKKKNEVIYLTEGENKLLLKLIDKKNNIVLREELAEIDYDENELRKVDVQITRLRQKIEENPKSPKYLQTIRGEGYVLWIE